MNLTSGTQLYKYFLKTKIGGGNFGQVWLAQDLTLMSEVAVKILDESMVTAAESLLEAQVGNRLNHQNVVKVHYADVASLNGVNLVLIAMDYHSNGSILSKLNSGNFIIAPIAISIAIDVLRGLEYLHEQQLFHNDIKPSNILVGLRNEALLTDYGISCVSPGLAPTAAPNAYILHRAPETAANGIISVVTDIYQVGLTLFRMINGIGLISDLMAKVGNPEFEKLKIAGKVPNQDDYKLFIPNDLRRIINKATHFDPSQRYQSALEMRRALEKLKIYGYWDTEPNGDLFGILGKYKFTFSIAKSNGQFDISSYKESIDTNRKTRISNYSIRVASDAEVNKLMKSFMSSVINGTI